MKKRPRRTALCFFLLHGFQILVVHVAHVAVPADEQETVHAHAHIRYDLADGNVGEDLALEVGSGAQVDGGLAVAHRKLPSGGGHGSGNGRLRGGSGDHCGYCGGSRGGSRGSRGNRGGFGHRSDNGDHRGGCFGVGGGALAEGNIPGDDYIITRIVIFVKKNRIIG